ncbi:MAG: hypothetical protein WBQ50_11675, partial [Nocardioides sp.]
MHPRHLRARRPVGLVVGAAAGLLVVVVLAALTAYGVATGRSADRGTKSPTASPVRTAPGGWTHGVAAPVRNGSGPAAEAAAVLGAW